MKVGIISLFWPPRLGGASQYPCRLAVALKRQGLEVVAFCGTSAEEDKDNGDFAVERWVSGGSLSRTSWLTPSAMTGGVPEDGVFKIYRFMDAATSWAIAQGLDIALINSPLQETRMFQARELFLQLKARNIKVGAIHHDIGNTVQKSLVDGYLKNERNWLKSAHSVRARLKSSVKQDRLKTYYQIGSPLFFAPDFIISCSAWSDLFVDPDNELPRFVFHPIIDGEYWSGEPSKVEGLSAVDILMLNPAKRKGPEIMAGLIKNARVDWRFRVVTGSWDADLAKAFVPKVKGTSAALEERIDFRAYVHDMREAYRRAKLIFFPSFFEGYGMTTVEAMHMGTPVVSSNYPAVLEGVGSAACSLCPFTSSPEQWRRAVAEVLHNREHWSAKALQRSLQVQERQKFELKALGEFFTSLL